MYTSRNIGQQHVIGLALHYDCDHIKSRKESLGRVQSLSGYRNIINKQDGPCTVRIGPRGDQFRVRKPGTIVRIAIVEPYDSHRDTQMEGYQGRRHNSAGSYSDHQIGFGQWTFPHGPGNLANRDCLLIGVSIHCVCIFCQRRNILDVAQSGQLDEQIA